MNTNGTFKTPKLRYLLLTHPSNGEHRVSSATSGQFDMVTDRQMWVCCHKCEAKTCVLLHTAYGDWCQRYYKVISRKEYSAWKLVLKL